MNKTKFYEEHVHQMTASSLRSHYVDIENKLSHEDATLTEYERNDLADALEVLAVRLDEITPHVGAQLSDHDVLSGNKATSNWPEWLPRHTLELHFHFCELIHAWSLNPHRRVYDKPTVVESSEANGQSRFAFESKESLEDFLDYYDLHSFVETKLKVDGVDGKTFWVVHLCTNYSRRDTDAFLTAYRRSMNTLAVIHEERNRAARNDGGKVGYILVDHFSRREMQELHHIARARQSLGVCKFDERG